MSMLNRRGATVVAALGLLFLAALRSTAAAMPEFGPSVQFDKSGPELSMSKLKGKAVLVIFFQSWCGICNGWAPNLIKQVEEAHASNRALVLVAIKTDGGGVAGAKEYLKGKGADLDKWCVGTDQKATYYVQVHGKDELWGYALVDGKGDIATQGSAGTFWSAGADKGKYVLSSPTLLKDCGKLETLLPADKEYPPELSKIVRFAETGCLGKALSLCASAAPTSKNAAALDGLKRDLLGIAESRIRKQIDILKDTGRDGGSRYASYQELAGMVKEFGALPAAREAATLLPKADTDPAIQKEKAAEAAYRATLQRMEKASKGDRPRLLKELETVATKYEGTQYGQLAAEARRSAEQAP